MPMFSRILLKIAKGSTLFFADNRYADYLKLITIPASTCSAEHDPEQIF